MTKREILECIKQNGPGGEAIYSALVACVAGELHNDGVSVLPDLAKFTVKKVPAREACTKNVLGVMRDLPAKPASNTVKAKVLKALIDQV